MKDIGVKRQYSLLLEINFNGLQYGGRVNLYRQDRRVDLVEAEEEAWKS